MEKDHFWAHSSRFSVHRRSTFYETPHDSVISGILPGPTLALTRAYDEKKRIFRHSTAHPHFSPKSALKPMFRPILDPTMDRK